MKKKVLVVGLAVLVAALGVWKIWFSGPKLAPETKQIIQAEQQAPTAIFTLADLEKHATSEDCWVASGGVVYDVTAFIATKEGESLATECGTDATVAYAELAGSLGDVEISSLPVPPVRKGDLAQ